MFVTSDDNAFRIMSMTLYNLVSILMIVILFISTCYPGKIFYQARQLKRLNYLLLWIVVSLLISWSFPNKAINPEVFNYEWTTGVNSPAIRGISFVIRFALGISVINFIVNSINNSKKYAIVMKYFFAIYGLFVLFPLIQIVLLKCNIVIGQVFNDDAQYSRIGSYVGEPSVLAGMLCCGIFPLVAAIKIPNKIVLVNKKYLIAILVIATLDLMFTYSLSVIIAIIITFILSMRKLFNKSILLIFILTLIALSIFNTDFQQAITLKFVRELTTINIRSLSWLIGFNAITNNMLTGVGIGQAPFFIQTYLLPVSDIPFDVHKYIDFASMRFTPMNTYIEFVMETGITGILILLCCIRYIYKWQKNKNRTKEERFIQFAFGAGLFAILIAMNSFPGGFYLGYFTFMIGMYIAGLKIYSNQKPQYY